MKPGALIAGKYRLTRTIGEGAMGTVWEAVNEGTSRQVAVKLIVRPTDELRHRLLREARACGALRHRNIVDVYDVGTTDEGDPFLVMQLLVGETLAERLSRQRRLDVPEAARVGRDVARALAAAHAASIVHRDLKPANIFLHDEPGEDATVVKVLDFGVSKNLAASDGLTTVAGGVVGSPAYMSPEQAGPGPIDHRADLWSLGVVLFEMLTGRRPLEGDANTILPQILSAPIPRLSSRVRNVDPRLEALVGRCLERDLGKRIASAADLANELQRFTAGGAPADAKPGLGQSTPGLVSPFSAGPRSDPAASQAIASVRAPFASVSDADPAARSPRPHGGQIRASGPSMPGVEDDDDDAATAKLSPQVLASAFAKSSQAEPPTAQMRPRNQGTLPIQSAAQPPAFGSGSYPRAEAAAAPPAPTFGSAPAASSRPLAATAKLDPNSPWAAQSPAAPAFPPAPESQSMVAQSVVDRSLVAQSVVAPSVDSSMPVAPGSDEYVTKRGTVRLSPEFSRNLPHPPATGAPNSPISSTAPLLQANTRDPSLSSGSAALVNPNRKRMGLLAAGVAVGVSLAIVVAVIIRVLLTAPAKPVKAQAAPTASVSASAADMATPSGEAPMASAAPSVATAAPVDSNVPAAPSASAAAVATPSSTSTSPKGKTLQGQLPRPVGSSTSKLPNFLSPTKKVTNPKGI